MEPKSMLTAVLLSLCLLPSNGRPNFSAGSLNHQNLTGGHYTSSSTTTTSTTTTTSRSYDIHFHRGYSIILNSYPLGEDGVTCQHRAQPRTGGGGYSMTNQVAGSLPTSVSSFSQYQSTAAGLPSNRISSSSSGILTNQMKAQNGMATPYIPSASQTPAIMPGTPFQGTASTAAGGILTSQTTNGISSRFGGQSQLQGSYPSTLGSQSGVLSNSYGASNGQSGALPAGQDLSRSQPYPYSGSAQSYSASSPQSYIVSGYGSNANNASYNFPNGVQSSGNGVGGMPYGFNASSLSTPYSSTYNNPSNSTYSWSATPSTSVNLSPVNCQVQCYSSDYQSPNKGGSCMYGISQTSTGYSSGRGRTPGVLQNSGMLISVQARQDSSSDFGNYDPVSMSY